MALRDVRGRYAVNGCPAIAPAKSVASCDALRRAAKTRSTVSLAFAAMVSRKGEHDVLHLLSLRGEDVATLESPGLVSLGSPAWSPGGDSIVVRGQALSGDADIYLVDLNPKTGRRSVYKTTVYKMLPLAFDPLASGLLPTNPRNLLRRKTASSTNRTKKK